LWLILKEKGHIAPLRYKRNAYAVLVGNPERRRALGRRGRRWEDNIQIDPGKIKWEYGLDLSGSG
jgi:hypothetical protein